jgi:hypothetical protein
MRQGTRFRSGSEARLSERLNWLRERHALPAPISITRATFSAVPATISFAHFTALIFEFASATQSGAIAAGLCLFYQVLLRCSTTNAICGHGRRRGGREDESEAHGRDGSNYQRSHLCISLDSSSGLRLMQCSDRGSHMVNFRRALELSEIAQYRAANVLKAGMLASFRQRKAARTSPAPAEQRRPR